MAEPMEKTAESFFLFRTGNGCFQFFRNIENTAVNPTIPVDIL